MCAPLVPSLGGTAMRRIRYDTLDYAFAIIVVVASAFVVVRLINILRR